MHYKLQLLTLVIALLGIERVMGAGRGARSCSEHSISSYAWQILTARHQEPYPMKVGDYNEEVVANYGPIKGAAMSLNYTYDTLAYVAVYDAKDFDDDYKAAFVMLTDGYNIIKRNFSRLGCIPSGVDLIEANEMNNQTHLPIVHVQTAGHVSGAAFFYQRSGVNPEPPQWANKTIFGVSIHPVALLDTRFSGVMVFKDIVVPNLMPSPPQDVYPTNDEKIRLLNEVNGLNITAAL